MISWISKYLSPFSSFQALEPTHILKETILVIDLETTGLDTRKDYILEAAVVPITGYTLRIQDAQCLRLKAEGYNPQSAHVHGILRSEAITPEHEGLSRLSSIIQSKWMVGHHVSFDCAILKNRCSVQGVDFRPKGMIDTQQMALKLDTGLAGLQEVSAHKYSLQTLCKRFNIPMEDEHTAAGDTLATALLFVKLLKIYCDRKMLVPAQAFRYKH